MDEATQREFENSLARIREQAQYHADRLRDLNENQDYQAMAALLKARAEEIEYAWKLAEQMAQAMPRRRP